MTECLGNKCVLFRARDNQTPHELLEEGFRTLGELVLHVKFFNLTFSNSLWMFKILMVGITVLGGFSAIRISHKIPVLGFLYGTMGIGAIVIFIGMFQFAYKVTEKVEKLMEVMEVKSAGLVNLSEKKYWKRRLRSIPRMGMKLGGFGRVEREAVPIFVDFCVKQILTLLITFK